MSMRHLVLLAIVSFSSNSGSAPAIRSGDLLGLSTGNTEAPAGQVVRVHAGDGKVEVLAPIVLRGGQRSGADLLVLQGRRRVLVPLVEIGETGDRTFLAVVEASNGRIVHEWAPVDGLVDALCSEAPGRALAVAGSSRPQFLARLDLDKESITRLAALDASLWIGSLAFDSDGALWGLHTRTPERDHDALVRIDRATSALLAEVRLGLPSRAMAFEIDAEGRFLVTTDDERLHEVDAATGKSKRNVGTGALRIVGLDRVR